MIISIQLYDNKKFIFVYQHGCLADFFDIHAIKKVYDSHGVPGINWDEAKDLMRTPIKAFSKGAKGIEIKVSENYKEDLVVKGLLLGYPVESTISYILSNQNPLYRCWVDPSFCL